MYHRHHPWQHHDLYPSHPWNDFTHQLSTPQQQQEQQPGPYTHHDLLAPRLALAGSLDPATGIFYRSPEHPRLRTAQACEKCRTRKAKCSGEHPTCKRCATRGLVCEYAKEGRVRGPNKPKAKAKEQQELTTSPASTAEMPDLLLASPQQQQQQQQQHRRHSEGRAVRPRPSNLRLERTRTSAPHAPSSSSSSSAFGDLYTSTSADSGARRNSCSLSESGGSLPSSAVSSTFELSPSSAQAYTSQADYPPSTQIHQLTHDQQQRLLGCASAPPTERHVLAHIHLDSHAPQHDTAEFDHSYAHQHHHQHHRQQQQQHYVPVPVPMLVQQQQQDIDYHSCPWPTQIHFTDTHPQARQYTYDAGAAAHRPYTEPSSAEDYCS